MRASWLAAGLLLVSSSTSCNSPPFYEKQVSERLHVEASEEPQKQLLVEHEECEIGFLRKYASSKLLAVRVLIAYNPGADDELRRTLSRKENEYVRGAVAASEHAPRWLLLELLSDQDSHVRRCLATHGSLTRDELLELYGSFQEPPLTTFAHNPNLPEEIREHILRSDNDLAKQWLEITAERKRHAGRI